MHARLEALPPSLFQARRPPPFYWTWLPSLLIGVQMKSPAEPQHFPPMQMYCKSSATMTSGRIALSVVLLTLVAAPICQVSGADRPLHACVRRLRDCCDTQPFCLRAPHRRVSVSVKEAGVLAAVSIASSHRTT